ncbi:gephyrin-like molybdotransferase Glp [Candidatus Neomarinimicrobiota bacterium]
MITVAEARQLIADHITIMEPEVVPLAQCAGRVLTDNVLARLNQPLFDNSAMDGYAVRAADLEGASKAEPVALPLAGTIAAGAEATSELGIGECQQIMTGAPLPVGADAVVMVEATSGFENDPVEFYQAPQVGQDIRRKGEETAAGELLFAEGHRLRAFDLGVIANHGITRLNVFRRPRVTIINTGNELRDPGETIEPGQIYNSNKYTLPGLVAPGVGEVVGLLTVDDNGTNLQTALNNALERSDIVVTTGGVSMGRYDQVRSLLSELGVDEVFWKIQQKPGKPLYFGKRDNILVFGLPGNPVSVLVTFMEYVWPVLFRLQGVAEPPPLKATLAAQFPRDNIKHRFLPGRMWQEDGHLLVRPSGKLGSHMLSSVADANVILSAGPGTGSLEAGKEILARLLPGAEIGTRA